MRRPLHTLLLALVAAIVPLFPASGGAQSTRRNPLPPPSARAGTAEVISLELQDADLQSTLRWLAERMRMNIVFDQGVSGKISVSLKNVPIEQVFELLLRTKGLMQTREGNVIIVRPLITDPY